jgi:hypothetical protein
MTVATILAGIPADRLCYVIDGWLWEFDEPENWPDRHAVGKVMQGLEARPDASTLPVRTALAKCRDYIATGL